MTPPDRRLHAYRPDLADAALRGRVEAARFVDGRPAFITAGQAPLRREPRPDAPLDTEALFGEAITVFEEAEGWAWVQLSGDGYVGYLRDTSYRLGTQAPTHRLGVLRSFIYPGPSMKLPPIEAISLGVRLTVEAREGDFVRLANGGFVWRRHVTPVEATIDDYVDVAEQFAQLPYLWGGKSSLGLDCSGLVQLALDAAGLQAPRDSDMMEKALGKPLAIGPDLKGLQRGDLVFWKGHVGIMTDPQMLLHANGHFMQVTHEPLAVAVTRIGAGARDNGIGTGLPTSFRRF